MPDNAEQSPPEQFDLDRQQIGVVYAKALLSAAKDESGVVMEELDSFVDDVLAETPKLDAALCSPRVPLEEKQKILDKAFQGRMNSNLLRFLKVVAGHDRCDCFRQIRSSAREIYNEQQGRVQVQVQSAEPLDEATANSIRERLTSSLGREVLIEQHVDPQLIGGLVVRVGDTVYDGSVANRLQRLRDRTLQRTAQTIRNSLERFSD